MDPRARETYAAIVALLCAQGLDARVVLVVGSGYAIKVGTLTGGFALWTITEDHWAYSLFDDGDLVSYAQLDEVPFDLLPGAMSQVIAGWPYDEPDAMERFRRLWIEGIVP